MSAFCARQAAPSSFATESSFLTSRPAITTFAPSRAKARAMPRPMPLPPPVMIATLSANRMEEIVADARQHSGVTVRRMHHYSGGRLKMEANEGELLTQPPLPEADPLQT